MLRAEGSEPDTGLSSTEAAARLAQHGRNELLEAAGRSIGRMVLGQLSDFMILMLIPAAVVSGLVGELTDTIAIIVIVLLDAATEAAQQCRVERAMASLRPAAAPAARVRRDGAPFPPTWSVALR